MTHTNNEEEGEQEVVGHAEEHGGYVQLVGALCLCVV